MADKKQPKNLFRSLNLGEPLIRAITKSGFRKPTPIQKRAIPVLNSGVDVVGMAKTGSGKTAAFVLPMVQRLKQHSLVYGARGLIISPTRELALQIGVVARKFVQFTEPQLRVSILVGGESLEDQFNALSANPDIIVATPGRLLHHRAEAKLSLKSVQLAVFDEADQLMEGGWAEQMAEISHALPEHSQIAVFSATMPEQLASFARSRLRAPEVIRLNADTKVPDTIGFHHVWIPREARASAALVLCRDVIPRKWRTIVFAATRHHCDYFLGMLTRAGLQAVSIYGTMDPRARRTAMNEFSDGKCQILVASDVAARGVDLPKLDCVLNLSFPPSPKIFVHRAGRTGRAGRSGAVWSLVAPDDLPYLLDTLLFLGRPLKLAADVPDDTLKGVCREMERLGFDQSKGKGPQGAALLNGDYARPLEGVVGVMPRQTLDRELAAERHSIQLDPELQQNLRSMKNSNMAVNASRPAASSASAERAKIMVANGTDSEDPKNWRPDVGTHPVFKLMGVGKQQVLGSVDSTVDARERERALSFLGTYRPDITVLEAGAKPEEARAVAMGRVRAAVSSKRQADEAAARAVAAMSERQRQDEDAQTVMGGNAHLALTAGDRAVKELSLSSRFSDPSFSLGGGPDAQAIREREAYAVRDGTTSAIRQAGRLEEAVLSMLPDDEAGLSILKRRGLTTKWDPVKGRYIRFDPKQRAAEERSKRARSSMRLNEAGQWIEIKGDKKTGDAYRRWKKKTHRELPGLGEHETMTTSEAQSLLRGQGFGNYRGLKDRMKGKTKGPRRAEPSKKDLSIDSSFVSAAHVGKERWRKQLLREHVEKVHAKKGLKSGKGKPRGKGGRGKKK
eukprot:gnl/Dysnectes_brevis/2614_a3158_1583.p1 GENE.gnl/Dysnectes_brevis/2614_a3158_1583~~gnl/Dysnectes_brevis/2614_a3158_1583.p1  ORF type:complete len:849 (-),score=246.26 gnl/Dysnectes_brevis/2614_a3158_1583:70-2616(-)